MFGRYFFYLRFNFYFSSYFDAFLFIYSFNWLCWEHPILCQQISSLSLAFSDINFHSILMCFFHLLIWVNTENELFFVYGKEAINRGPNSEILVFAIFLSNFDICVFSLNWLFDHFQLYPYNIPCVCFSIRFDIARSYGF